MLGLKFPIYQAIKRIGYRNLHLASLYDSFAKARWEFDTVEDEQLRSWRRNSFPLTHAIRAQNDEIKGRIKDQYRHHRTSQPISRPVSYPLGLNDRISTLKSWSLDLTGEDCLPNDVPLYIIERIIYSEAIKLIENRMELKAFIAAMPFPPYNPVNLFTTYIPTYFELGVRSLAEIIRCPGELAWFRFRRPLNGWERFVYSAIFLIFGLPLLALWGIGNFVDVAADNIAHLRLTLVAATNGAVGPLAKNFLLTAIILTGMIATVMFCIPVFGQMAAGGVLALIAFAKALSFILAGGLAIKGTTFAVNKIINVIRRYCGLKYDSHSDDLNRPPAVQELVDAEQKEQKRPYDALMKDPGANPPSSAPAKSERAATAAEIEIKNKLRDHVVRYDHPSPDYDAYLKYANAAEEDGYTQQQRSVGGENENYLVYLQNFNAPYNIFSTPMRVADVIRLLGDDITVYKKREDGITQSDEETQLPKELLQLAHLLPSPDSAAAKQEPDHQRQIVDPSAKQLGASMSQQKGPFVTASAASGTPVPAPTTAIAVPSVA